ncbi:hydrolase [Catenovulum sp. 2E275]|uniref:hydrolase n=1 Tax=Catenovulum sp. 2E275 TaxID=2980497 RepID=UPI0021CE9312|nr:hydrolase [Catenovulum sp. 2E275]MCU4674884.1 hydrolase [Catenovulum sp. 2E275]
MIIESQFKPAWWLKNKHLQTVWQKIERRNLTCPVVTEQLELADGDFLEINWTKKPAANTQTPIVVVLHGLEGSVNSTYSKGMMNAIKAAGWTGLLIHFRSCGGKANRLPRAYHSGETGDLAFVCNWVKQHFKQAPLAAIGFSLGANVLCKFAGETAEDNPFLASVAICPPLDLAASCRYIQTGSSQIYQKYLLDMLLDNLSRKLQRVNLNPYVNITPEQFHNIKNLWQFDDLVTAPLHGFKNAQDYYDKSSGKQFLKTVAKPLLVIHAADDPFLSPSSIPALNELAEPVTFELSQKGGHVGFISGNCLFKGEYWLEKRALDYISELI